MVAVRSIRQVPGQLNPLLIDGTVASVLLAAAAIELTRHLQAGQRPATAWQTGPVFCGSGCGYRDRDRRDSTSELAIDWSLPSSGISSSPARYSGIPPPPTIVKTTKASRMIITSTPR